MPFSKLDQGHYTCLKIYFCDNYISFFGLMDTLWVWVVGFCGVFLVCLLVFYLPYKTRIAGFKLEFYLKENPQLNT